MPCPAAFHPEPELIDYRDEARARAGLERLGKAIWDEALDYLYREAQRRPTSGDPYPETRRRFFGESFEPCRAPEKPSTAEAVLEGVRAY